MPNPTGRRFTLADVMIMVAAIAVGVAGARTIHENSYARSCDHAAPFLASWTVASIAFRLRNPRPRLRLALRQPGMVAGCAAAFALAAEAVFLVASALIADKITKLPHLSIDIMNYIFLYLTPAGKAVAAAWLALAMAGRWRSERGWVDRQGRVLGVCWIVLWVVSELGLP